MSDPESTWQPAHPSASTSPTSTGAHQPTGGRHQPPAPGAPATHQIVTTSAPGLATLVDLVDDTSTDGVAGAGGREGVLTDALFGLRFVSESPGSLRDQIAYAREAAYSNRTDGPWRKANIWFARLVAIPGLTICYSLAWALFTRLSRAMTAWPVILLIMWLLISLPVTRWFIRELADLMMWIAGPDPSLVPREGE